MDIDYQNFTFSSQNNHGTGSDHLSRYFPSILPEQPMSQSSEISRTPSILGAADSMFDFSSPQLVDYSIFDTPVDVSVGTLPPRPTTSRALAQGRIPRPRNAFMLFRSAFHREKHLLKSVEKDHRHISRIIGLCWAELSEAEKDVWRQKAELEKQQHALTYPDYRFKPTPRTKLPVKRNVKRNSPKEIERCRKIAKLIQTGKSGEELTHAVRRMDDEAPFTSPGTNTALDERGEYMQKRQTISDHTHPVHSFRSIAPQFMSTGQQPSRCVPVDEDPPFRNPLPPLPDLPKMSSKRPYPDAALEPAGVSQMQQPLAADNQLGSSCISPPYPNQYLSGPLDQGTKYHQRSQIQFQQDFEFSSVTAYDPASAHYSTYSTTSASESTPAPDTFGDQYIPSNIGWNLYYGPSVLPDSSASAPGAYESYYNNTAAPRTVGSN